MIILNIATFVTCLGMLILFRRIDKSNMKMTKLRRYSNKMFDDFRKLAETEKRKFNDATIEMDILIKKSNSLTTNLSQSLREIENRLGGLNVEKENLKKVEDDIKVISHAARDVNKQIEFIAMAKNDFADMTGRIVALQENMTAIRSDSGNLINGFNSKLRERSRELMDEFSSIVNSHTATFSEKEEQILSLKSTLSDLENTVFADIREKSEQMKGSINKAVSDFDGMRDTLFERLDEDIEKIYGKLKNVENTVDESKSNLIETFQNEVTRVRTEMDNLSIHTIAKKDEIVQAARNEAEDIRKKIEEFQDKVNSNENRIKNEFSGMEQHLSEIREEIVRYEKQNRIFERSDNMIEKVDTAVSRLSSMLETAQNESAGLTRFIEEVDDLKELRKSVTAEIRSYQARREKLEDVENNIHNLMEMSDLALNRMDMMKENLSKIDFINARMDSLGQSYADLDSRIEELREYEGLINKNLEAATRSEMLLKSVDGKLQNFQKVLDRSDKKVEKVNDHLRDIEEKTLILKTRGNEIQELKEKFDEIDGIGEVMTKRIDQIYAMFKKVETLREEIEDTDSRLQTMFVRTDEKMKEFADFIQSVDAGNIISKQVKKEAAPGKNINEHLIKTVRELSDRGWSPDAIAKKMLLDENSVRFIINTTSM